MQAKGRLYLVPIPIAEDALQTLSPEIAACTLGLSHYFAEDLRTARRFLRALHPKMVIDTIQFSEIDKHKGPDVKQLKVWLNAGIDVGVMSEAGCPGVADPGAELVAATHNMGAEVIPLTGPSSILLALMASGLNGQSFAFAGYLPLKEPARSKKIQMVEQRSQNEQQTQIFIETPYRNSALLSELLKVCKNNTRLCIAQNITAKNAVIKTKTIAEWKKEIPRLEKAPAVFLILA